MLSGDYIMQDISTEAHREEAFFKVGIGEQEPFVLSGILLYFVCVAAINLCRAT